MDMVLCASPEVEQLHLGKFRILVRIFWFSHGFDLSVGVDKGHHTSGSVIWGVDIVQMDGRSCWGVDGG